MESKYYTICLASARFNGYVCDGGNDAALKQRDVFCCFLSRPLKEIVVCEFEKPMV